MKRGLILGVRFNWLDPVETVEPESYPSDYSLEDDIKNAGRRFEQ